MRSELFNGSNRCGKIVNEQKNPQVGTCIPEIVGKYLDLKSVGSSKRSLLPITIDIGYHKNLGAIGNKEVIIAKLPSMLKGRIQNNADMQTSPFRSIIKQSLLSPKSLHNEFTQLPMKQNPFHTSKFNLIKQQKERNFKGNFESYLVGEQQEFRQCPSKERLNEKCRYHKINQKHCQFDKINQGNLESMKCKATLSTVSKSVNSNQSSDDHQSKQSDLNRTFLNQNQNEFYDTKEEEEENEGISYSSRKYIDLLYEQSLSKKQKTDGELLMIKKQRNEQISEYFIPSHAPTNTLFSPFLKKQPSQSLLQQPHNKSQKILLETGKLKNESESQPYLVIHQNPKSQQITTSISQIKKNFNNYEEQNCPNDFEKGFCKSIQQYIQPLIELSPIAGVGRKNRRSPFSNSLGQDGVFDFFISSNSDRQIKKRNKNGSCTLQNNPTSYFSDEFDEKGDYGLEKYVSEKRHIN